MIEYEELKDRIEMLETMVNDLQWRINQVCNKLSIGEEEPEPEPKYKVGDTVYRLNADDGEIKSDENKDYRRGYYAGRLHAALSIKNMLDNNEGIDVMRVHR